MKTMKRIVACLLAVGMVLSIAACGGSEQSVTLKTTQDVYGISMTDTMTLNAKGDTVQELKEVLEVDLADFSDDQKAAVKDQYDAFVDMYNAVDGCTASGSLGDTSYTISITVDCTGNALNELNSQGLMAITGNGGRISLKASQQELEKQGYTVVQ